MRGEERGGGRKTDKRKKFVVIPVSDLSRLVSANPNMHEISGARRDRKTLTHFHPIDPLSGRARARHGEREREEERERERERERIGGRERGKERKGQWGNNVRLVVK